MESRYKGARYKAAAIPEVVAAYEADEIHAMDFYQWTDHYELLRSSGILNHMPTVAYLGAVDRYFLFVHILHRADGLHPWIFNSCREVELEPDYHLDLWSREHYKSSLITFAGIIQEIVNDPEITIGIFSHTQKIAMRFCQQIMREFEANHLLRGAYRDVCWIKPRSEAPVWSSLAFTVRRHGNPKEGTVEAWGLVEGQPTSKHFKLRVYDDVVTRESVTNPEQIKKTTEAWELSDNLSSGEGRYWMIGTRYHFGDTYGTILDRDIVTPRLKPATHNGKMDGRPVLLSDEAWDKKKRTQKSTVAAQMLQNPLSGKEQRFLPEWFKPYVLRPGTLNVYLLADPSKGSNRKSDRTAMAVIGVDRYLNRYLLDGVCHRMKLSERWDWLKRLHKKWSRAPGVGFVKVGYERYGMQSDLEHFEEKMRDEHYSFAIHEVAWTREGGQSKIDRVERLQPYFENGEFLLPATVFDPGKGDCLWAYDPETETIAIREKKGLLKQEQEAKDRGQSYLIVKPIMRKNEEGDLYDLTRALFDEMIYFPFATHDDLVDCVSRTQDIGITAPLVDDIPVDASPVHEDA